MKTRNINYSNSSTASTPNRMSDQLTTAEASAKAVQLELSAIRREKEKDYDLNQNGRPTDDDEELGGAEGDESSDDEPSEQDTVKAALKANTKMAKEMANAVKKMTKESRKQRKRDPLTPPEPKRARTLPEKVKEKPDGKAGRPSPLAFVVGENPEVARDSEGNIHSGFNLRDYKYIPISMWQNITFRGSWFLPYEGWIRMDAFRGRLLLRKQYTCLTEKTCFFV
jgi:hypothetical protein